MNPVAKSLRSLGRKQIWGWPLFWFALPIYFLLSLAFDVFLDNSWRIEWLIIAVVSFLAAVVLSIILKAVFVDRLFSSRGTWIANITIFSVVGAFKNSLVGLMSLYFGLTNSVDWLFRIYGGAGLAFGILIAFVYLLGARVEHNGLISELASTRSKLVALRSQAKVVLAGEREALLRQTQETILPRLDEIQRSLASNSERIKLVDDLRDLVTQRVRPLSDALSKAATNLEAFVPEPVTTKQSSRFFNDRKQLKVLIRPGAASVFMLAGNWVLAYIVVGVTAANWGLVYSLATLAVLAVAKALTPPAFKVAPKQAMWLLVLIGFIAANATYWPLKEFSHNFEQDLLLLLVVLNILGCVVGFAYSKGVDLDRVEAVKQIIGQNNALAREAALFEQQMWIARRNWSFVVHGTVQAALTAAITRLSSAEQLEEYQIQLVRQDLARAADALSKTPEPDIDLNASLANLATTWKGICEISFQLSERATRSLQRDSNARMCVNEICKEAVSNAVRHGEASKVAIEIDRSVDELLIISASNNGRAVPASPRPGVGSRMLDDLTTTWSISNNRATGQTVLEAKLPLAAISAGTL